MWRFKVRKKGAALSEALIQNRTSSIYGLRASWASKIGFYRFINNDRVSEEAITTNISKTCYTNCEGKRVLALVDTTEINCEGFNNRLLSQQGLGCISDNATLGFYMHPTYCLEEQTLSVLGIAHVRVWSRPPISVKHTRWQRYITEKETDKWYTDLQKTQKQSLSKAKHITYVMDREADIYEVLANIADNRTDVVIRSKQNRALEGPGGKRMYLHDKLKHNKWRGTIEFKLQNKKRKNKRVKAQIRYIKANILKPVKGKLLPGTPGSSVVHVVEVKEQKRQNTSDRIHWILLTTKTIRTVHQAMEVVDIYRRRWQVEELFRLMKKESFNIEASELTSGKNIRKLALYVMEASLKIQQLKSARDGTSLLKTKSVFREEEISCLKVLNKKLCGQTEKLKNPYNPENLAWASWIIAKLGGWSGYQSQRPPGPIIFKRGLERFEHVFWGFKLFDIDVYKP